jgi:ElaB/YqjD/DUF883 family membrane-anchored ribosome-binding protein
MDKQMSSTTESDLRRSGMRQASSRDADDVAAQIDSIRTDLQNLTTTVGNLAKTQMNRAQDKAVETAVQAEEVIRRNPLQAVGLAAGLGFLFGLFTRR